MGAGFIKILTINLFFNLIRRRSPSPSICYSSRLCVCLGSGILPGWLVIPHLSPSRSHHKVLLRDVCTFKTTLEGEVIHSLKYLPSHTSGLQDISAIFMSKDHNAMSLS